MRQLIAFLVCCGNIVMCAACSRPPDNTPSKFQRQANIEKYVQKARQINRLGEERQKPLQITDPVNPSRLTNQAQETDTSFLTRMFERSRHSLETQLLETYSQQSSKRLSALFEQYRQQALAAVREAASPDDLAQKLRNLREEQNKQWDEFIAAQSGKVRIQPDQALLEAARKRLDRRCKEYLDRLDFYYGPAVAEQSRPVLEKAMQDYVYAMASAANAEELDKSLAQIQEQTSAQIKQIAAQAGDPLGITPEEMITSLRADMIHTHRQLEEQVEMLYGKDAVLQARTVFNHCLEETGKALRENARLSQKKRALAHLNEHYRQSLLALQQQWNKAWEEKKSQPPSYLLTHR